MIVRFHPAALQELREAEWYIEERRPGWGARFRAEVTEVIQFLQEQATSSEAFRRKGTGSMKVRRFPYRVHYRIKVDELWIKAVYHGKRRPDGWKGCRL
jgi:toxin ParE1/3/4